MLAESEVESKIEFCEVLHERAAKMILIYHNIRTQNPFNREPSDIENLNFQFYNIVKLFQERLAKIIDDDNIPKDIIAFLLVQAQDILRAALIEKSLPVEDRNNYADQAPEELRRTQDEFLNGEGILNLEDELD